MPHVPSLFLCYIFLLKKLSLLTLWVQLVLPTGTWVWWHPLGHEQPTISHIPKRDLLSLPQEPLMANHFCGRVRPQGPSPSRLEFWLAGSYTGIHSCCVRWYRVLMHSPATSCLEVTFHSQWSFSFWKQSNNRHSSSGSQLPFILLTGQ